MPGVVIQAQAVSQILSAVEGARPGQPAIALYWFWPEWGEGLWIWLWCLLGSAVVSFSRHSLQVVFGAAGGIAVGLGVSYGLLIHAGWIPVVAPLLGFVSTGVGVLILANSKNRKNQQLIQAQNEAIRELKSLLSTEPTSLPPELEEPHTVNTNTAIALQTLVRGRYLVLDTLGTGGFGITFLTKDTHHPGKRLCVLKHLLPCRRESEFYRVGRRLFHAEAQILKRLGKHPQIPEFLDYFEENQEFFLVEEFVDGSSLSTELLPSSLQTQPYTVQLVVDILEILKFVHSHGVIHRDVKPDNLIRRASNRQIVLIDFGSVKQLYSHNTNQTVVVGTRGYAAPEQLQGFPHLNSDLFSVGMIGLQALTGHPTLTLREKLLADRGSIAGLFASQTISPSFITALERLVQPDWQERYQSADEALDDLKLLQF
jgi:predicted Ser/Thr protein kinase